MTDQKLILKLARLALSGDPEGARSLLGKLLRNVPTSTDPAGDEFREALANLLLASSATSRTTESARRAVGTSGADHLGPPVTSQLTRVETPGRLLPPILPGVAQAALDSVIAERTQAEHLRRQGVEPTRSVLFTGAPGVGKTMSARYIASILDLPLVTVDLAGVMSSYLGQTGQNVRRALDVARATSCVLFIDEIDALAKRRNDDTDVGELKRIVTILLHEIEHWPSHSLLLAATNHPELLDRAIWRRFDRVIHLSRPGFEIRRRILDSVLAEHGREVADSQLALCAAATVGMPGSSLGQLTRDAIRDSLIAGDNDIGPRMVRGAMRHLDRNSRRDGNARAVFCELATSHLGFSQREIARRLGISHVQVGRIMKQRLAQLRSVALSTVRSTSASAS